MRIALTGGLSRGKVGGRLVDLQPVGERSPGHGCDLSRGSRVGAEERTSSPLKEHANSRSRRVRKCFGGSFSRQGMASDHRFDIAPNLISDTAKAAVGPDRSAHGLRKSWSFALVEDGATTTQGTAWTGHLTSAECEHYSKNRDCRAAITATDQGQPPCKVPDII